MSLNIIPYPTASGMARAIAASAGGLALQVKYIAVGSGLQPIVLDAAGRAETDTLKSPVGYVEVIHAEQVNPYQWQLAVDLVGIRETEWNFAEFALCDADKQIIAIYGSATQALMTISPVLDNALLAVNLVLGTFPANSITIEHHNIPLHLINDELAALIIVNSLQIEKDQESSLARDNALEQELGQGVEGLSQQALAHGKQLTNHNNQLQRLRQDTDLLIYASWSQFEYVTELNRMTWGSGVAHARGYEYGGDSAYHLPTSTGYSPYNGHDHGNIENLVGTGEFGVMVNGIYCRARHNDDGLYMHALMGNDYNQRRAIPVPAEPADIAAATTPPDKVALAEQYIRVMAGQLPPSAVADYANAAQWVMTGVEVYPEVYQPGESLRDPFPGHRHQINVDTLPQLFKQEQFYNNGGHKNIRENSLGIAMAINDVDADGKPVVVLWRYRFISAPVGSLADYPIDDLLQYHEDAANHYRWGLTTAGMLESRQARFRIRQRLGQDNVPSQWNQPELIDELVAKIPGLDGYGNTLTEEYHYYGADDVLKTYGNTAAPLKAGYYNRWYTMTGKDASNRSNAKRGFSDDRLWVARTRDPRIKQTTFGSESYGFSYFIPLELHLQSFLNGSFNPYGIADVSSQYTTEQMQALVAQGYGASAAKPLPGHNNFYYFYKNPADIFDGASPTDPADTTVRGGLWIKCADGVSRKHFPSGYGYFMPTTGLIGSMLRTRYPIYYAAYEGSDAHKYLEAARAESSEIAAGVIRNALALEQLYEQVRSTT